MLYQLSHVRAATERVLPVQCVWWVPDFSVERHRDTLRRLDADIRERGPFVAHSTRTLIEARRVDR